MSVLFKTTVLAFVIGLLGCAHATPDIHPAPALKMNRVIDWSKYNSSVILKTYRGKNSFICSAVLLSDTLGLTTAHCIEKSDRNEILLGMSLTDPELKTIGVNQKSIRIHPKYKPAKSLYDHDLAVFELSQKAGLKVYPQLPDAKLVKLEPESTLDRFGFGLRNNQNSRTWTELFFDKREPETLFLNDKLSVLGDSGSPIYWSNEGKLYAIGIHSTLIEEGHVAAPFLPAYKNWIFSKKKK